MQSRATVGHSLPFHLVLCLLTCMLYSISGSGTGFDGSMTAGIWEQRFNEMDWNHDGSIQFKEFLMAFESWVGLDEDDVNESVT